MDRRFQRILRRLYLRHLVTAVDRAECDSVSDQLLRIERSS